MCEVRGGTQECSKRRPEDISLDCRSNSPLYGLILLHDVISTEQEPERSFRVSDCMTLQVLMLTDLARTNSATCSLYIGSGTSNMI